MTKRWLFAGAMLPVLFVLLGATAALPTFTKIIIDPNPGNVPVEKEMADLNGDGKLDLIIGLENAGLYWWEFPASGRITDPWVKHTIKASGNFYEDIHAIDLNGDGRPDILCSVDGSVRWYQHPGGNGTGAWIEHYLTAGTGHEIAIADFDGDGKPDYATSRSHLIVFQNNPTSWTSVNYGGKYDGLALLDIGSGRGAINLVAENDSGIVWFENPREHGGNARTDAWIQHYVAPRYGANDQGLALAAADLNRDGRMDLISAPNEGTPDPNIGLIWWEAPADRRSGTWIKHTIDSSYLAVHKIVPADVDNNGSIDLVLAEQEQSPQDRVAIFYNNGSGGFTQVVLETTGGQNNVVKDVDGDGDLDILNVNQGFYGAAHPIELFVNNLNSGAPPPPPPPGQAPWGGSAAAIPGKILAVNYDTGGEGVAYHDLESANQGGQYRTGEGVDIGTSSMSGGNGYSVGWCKAGEWIEYTVNVTASGAYTLAVPVALPFAGGTFHIEFNGADKTGAFTVPNTGGADTWQTITKTGISLSAGTQVMRVVMDTNGSAGWVTNLNTFTFTASGGGGGGGGGVIGTGTGLKGEYFDNPDFTALKMTRTDGTVNFDWGSGSPDPSVGPDGFSVRWTGQVQASFGETYTFYTTSDDGIRLWVNGVQLVNNWTDHGPTENSGTIALSAGQKVDLKLEFYENGGGATAKLLWSSASTPKQVIPQSQLYPAAGGGGGGTTGALSGSSAANAGTYDLTSLGTSDWTHWGRGAVYGNFDHKSGGLGQISNVTVVGTGANSGGWSDAARGVTWSDGTPTLNGNDHGYIWSNGALGTGYSFTVPADPAGRTIRIYYGASTATCTLSAHLSDGSAPDYARSNTGPGAWLETINYRSASAGQFLTIKLLKTGNNAGFTDGSADLSAAMLQSNASFAATMAAEATAPAAEAKGMSSSGGGACGLLGAELLVVLGLARGRRRARSCRPTVRPGNGTGW